MPTTHAPQRRKRRSPVAGRHVLVLHDSVPASAPPEAQDTLVQAGAVAAALRALGCPVTLAAAPTDLAALAEMLERERPALVFNLVESLVGTDAAMVAATVVLDGLGIPYTGSPSAAIALVNDKPLAKSMMRRTGLPTPDWYTRSTAIGASFVPGRYVVKACFEHASVGFDEHAVVSWSGADEARRQLAERRRAFGRPCFAEAYVDGREFNVSLLAGSGRVDVLPPAEIDFSAYPAGKARVVGYRAKWIEDSFEFHHTPRRFDFTADDRALLDEIATLARTAFSTFGLEGYARVDFRVDATGPWILELNANPCLAPDAGFAAAAARAGIKYDAMIERIVAAALDESDLHVPNTPDP
jgi:D-alanine-D-alanine ligase